MAEKEELIKEKLDHSGIFDFKAFYSYAHKWLLDEEFGVVEEKYAEKISGTNTRDIDIEWVAKKKLSDYFRIDFKLEFEIRGLTDVEVEIDGERKRSQKGKVSLTIKGALIIDHQNKWETPPFYKMMRDIYNKFIIPARVEEMREIVRRNAISLNEEVKAFLELSGRR